MKDSFVIYTKYEEQINMLTDEQAGVLFRALMRYQNGAELPAMDGVTAMAFSFIKQQMDFDNHKYEEICQANKANGQLGGRPSKSLKNKEDKPKKPSGFESCEEKANGFFKNRTKPKNPQSDNDNDYDTDIITPIIPYEGKGEGLREEFFAKYPSFRGEKRCDDSHVDYAVLLREFERSTVLRGMYSFAKICGMYDAIAKGDFRDKDKPNPFAGADAKAARERWYAERKAAAERKAESVLDRFLQDEEFKRIHKRLAELPCKIGNAEYQIEKGNANAKKQLVELTQEKARLTLQYRGIIEKNGMTEEDLLPKWHCWKCKDTGYQEDDKMCDCYEVAL